MLSNQKIEHITCTSNFGIFKERDEKIVDKLIQLNMIMNIHMCLAQIATLKTQMKIY